MVDVNVIKFSLKAIVIKEIVSLSTTGRSRMCARWCIEMGAGNPCSEGAGDQKSDVTFLLP